MVNSDVRECSVMWLSIILAFDGRCLEFHMPFHLALLLRLRVVLRQFVDGLPRFPAAV